mgnify:CR=1 FL=1
MPTDLELVRQVLARELDTINQYEQAAREAESELIRAFFRHLADEEKEHVAEAIQLLHQMDAAQRAHFSAVDVRVEHFAGAPSAAARPAPEPAAPPRHTFTVGSLKRRKDVP